jgi:hypothetical protein
MAVVIAAAGRTAMLNALRETVESGSLEILSGSDQVLAVFPLAADAGAVSGNVWALDLFDNSVVGTAAAGAGTTAAKARFKAAGGAVMLSGLTVSLPAGAGEVKLDNVSISQGQGVSITAAAISWS